MHTHKDPRRTGPSLVAFSNPRHQGRSGMLRRNRLFVPRSPERQQMLASCKQYARKHYQFKRWCNNRFAIRCPQQQVLTHKELSWSAMFNDLRTASSPRNVFAYGQSDVTETVGKVMESPPGMLLNTAAVLLPLFKSVGAACKPLRTAGLGRTQVNSAHNKTDSI
jgi:hypothetical protein